MFSPDADSETTAEGTAASRPNDEEDEGEEEESPVNIEVPEEVSIKQYVLKTILLLLFHWFREV